MNIRKTFSSLTGQLKGLNFMAHFKKYVAHKYVWLTVYFVLAFLAFTYLKLPLDNILDRYWGSYKDKLPLEIKYSEVRAALPVGLHFARLSIGDAGAEKPYLTLDDTKITLSLWSFLTGQKGVNISGKLWGGKLRFRIASADEGYFIKGKISKANLEKYPAKEKMGIGLGGKLSGKADLTTPAGTIGDLSGRLELNWDAPRLDEGNVKGVNTPKITAEKMELALNINAGQANIEKAVLSGPDVNGSLTGDVLFQNNLKLSRLNCEGKLKFSEKLAQESAIRLALAFFKPDNEGYHHILMRGTLNHPLKGGLIPGMSNPAGASPRKIHSQPTPHDGPMAPPSASDNPPALSAPSAPPAPEPAPPTEELLPDVGPMRE